jgi:hypothetical protein
MTDCHEQIDHSSETVDSELVWCAREINGFIEVEILRLQEMDNGDKNTGREWYDTKSFGPFLGKWYRFD